MSNNLLVKEVPPVVATVYMNDGIWEAMCANCALLKQHDSEVQLEPLLAEEWPHGLRCTKCNKRMVETWRSVALRLARLIMWDWENIPQVGKHLQSDTVKLAREMLDARMRNDES